MRMMAINIIMEGMIDMEIKDDQGRWGWRGMIEEHGDNGKEND